MIQEKKRACGKEKNEKQNDSLLDDLGRDRLVVPHEVCAHFGDVVPRGARVVRRRHHLVHVARHVEAGAEGLRDLCVFFIIFNILNLGRRFFQF